MQTYSAVYSFYLFLRIHFFLRLTSLRRLVESIQRRRHEKEKEEGESRRRGGGGGEADRADRKIYLSLYMIDCDPQLFFTFRVSLFFFF